MQFKNPIRMVEEMENVSPTVRGIFSTIASGAFFATMHGSVRLLSQDLDAMEIAFFRAFFGFLFFAPILVRTRLSVLRTSRLPLHMLRGLFNGASLLLWFTALSMVPLGDATALSLLGPLFVAMGAMFILGEKVHGPRWLALVIGFAGCSRDCSSRISEIRSGHDADACLDVIRHVFETDCQVFVPHRSTVNYRGLSVADDDGAVGGSAFLCLADAHANAASGRSIGFIGSCGHMLLTTAYKIADISRSGTRSICASRLGGDRWLVHVRGNPGVLWIWIGEAR